MVNAAGFDALAVVAQEALAEAIRAERLHPNQDDLPDGLAPGAPTIVLDAIGDRTGRALAAFSNAGLADALRTRCQDATAAGALTWEQILSEEWGEAIGARSVGGLRVELVQIAAVCLRWAAAIDGRDDDA